MKHCLTKYIWWNLKRNAEFINRGIVLLNVRYNNLCKLVKKRLNSYMEEITKNTKVALKNTEEWMGQTFFGKLYFVVFLFINYVISRTNH